MKLVDALEALAPALQPTPRFAVVHIVLRDGYASAFNGELAARVSIDGDFPEVALDGGKLAKVLTRNSTLKFGDVFATVKTDRVSHRLLMHDASLVMIPPFVPPDRTLSKALCEAISDASDFASQNAMHLWACGVTITPDGVIATNNQVLVFVPHKSDFELTLPNWAVKVINGATGIGWNDNAVCFEYDGRLQIQAQRLSTEMPQVVGKLASESTDGDVAIGSSGLRQLLDEISVIGDGRFVVLGNRTLSIEHSSGEQSVADIAVDGEFKLSVETAKLVFSVASHISFAQVPGKLIFSRQYPNLRGFAAGVR